MAGWDFTCSSARRKTPFLKDSLLSPAPMTKDNIDVYWEVERDNLGVSIGAGGGGGGGGGVGGVAVIQSASCERLRVGLHKNRIGPKRAVAKSRG